MPRLIYVGDAQRMAGTWRLVSIVYEDAVTGERVASPGENTKGYQIATPEGWWMTLITNEPRRAMTGGDAGVAASGPVIAFAGKYRLERGKVLIKVEAGRVSGVIGTELASPYRFDANRLRMELPQNLSHECRRPLCPRHRHLGTRKLMPAVRHA